MVIVTLSYRVVLNVLLVCRQLIFLIMLHQLGMAFQQVKHLLELGMAFQQMKHLLEMMLLTSTPSITIFLLHRRLLGIPRSKCCFGVIRYVFMYTYIHYISPF